MRKEKLSYIVLVAEVVAIIFLHSIKSSDARSAGEEQTIAKGTGISEIPPAIHQVAIKTR